MEALVKLVSPRVTNLKWAIHSALSPIRLYFAKYFAVTVTITSFTTIEGHFSLTYEVTRDKTKEKIKAEVSFITTLNLRNIVKYHIYKLYLELDKIEWICGRCGRRHYGDGCPRIISCPSSGSHPPEYFITEHLKPTEFALGTQRDTSV